MSPRNVRKLVKCELFHEGKAHSKTCFGQLKVVIDCECSVYIDFPLTWNWECSTKTSPFRTSSLQKGRNAGNLFRDLRNLRSSIDDLVLEMRVLRISHFQSLFGNCEKKRYSSSLKVVKETVRKCLISQKSWCIELDIRNFRDKNGDAWKSFDFFDTQIKTPSGSDYACSRESTLRSVRLLPFDAISIRFKMLMQILY